MDNSELVRIQNLRFCWPNQAVDTLQIDRFYIGKTEKVFVQGPSGSGKSTLLNVIGGVLKPRAGDINILGQHLGELNATTCDRFRADHIGYIFQQFNLIPYLSIVENVILPCRFSKLRNGKAIERAGSLLDEARHLLDRLFPTSSPDLNQRVTELSVGQQQRVAVARALIGQPDLVIADEPTSSLDTGTRETFMELLFEEVDRSGSGLLFVSHDPTQKHRFDRCLDIVDFQLQVSA
ncbi:MAG: ABC transporter ATP-binding protein [Gammaproteobacteria bacterium]|nr:ABC transporter ATP-binding protein [Gammaproteobacteria bacterium]